MRASPSLSAFFYTALSLVFLYLTSKIQFIRRPFTSLTSPTLLNNFRMASTGSAAYFEAVKTRRSVYALSASSPIPDSKIVEIVNDAVLHSPSSFNSQSSRVLLVFGEHHIKVWQFVKDAVKAIVPAEAWPASEKRISGFQNAYGTALLFEDKAAVETLQKNIPLYADRFPQWSEHAHGILAHVIWTALEAEGLGANLQHYNPLIDANVAAAYDIPESWRLTAQVVFGKKEAEAGEKKFQALEERVKVFGASA